MSVSKIKTKVLRQAYELTGPTKGEPLILVHGWPDSLRTWDKVLPLLHQAGYQTIVPYLADTGRVAFEIHYLVASHVEQASQSLLLRTSSTWQIIPSTDWFRASRSVG